MPSVGDLTFALRRFYSFLLQQVLRIVAIAELALSVMAHDEEYVRLSAGDTADAVRLSSKSPAQISTTKFSDGWMWQVGPPSGLTGQRPRAGP